MKSYQNPKVNYLRWSALGLFSYPINFINNPNAVSRTGNELGYLRALWNHSPITWELEVEQLLGLWMNWHNTGCIAFWLSWELCMKGTLTHYFNFDFCFIWKTEQERDPLPTGSIPKRLQQPDSGQAETGSQDLSGSPAWLLGTQILELSPFLSCEYCALLAWIAAFARQGV